MISLSDLPPLDRRVLEHVTYALRATPLLTYPFPHFFARDVFPADFYDDLVHEVQSRPDDLYHANEGGKYASRVFLDDPADHISGIAGLRTREFTNTVLGAIFGDYARARFPDGKLALTTDLRLIRDTTGYSIGPHTDARWKLISLLFYLPPPRCSDPRTGHGTSIYVPLDPGFRCPGGPHHKPDGFIRVWTAPFAPNSCLGFWKTDRAFHGVEPITTPAVQRDVLLYNVYDQSVPR